MAPLTAKLAELGGQSGANMTKVIDSKIDHLFDASWDRPVFNVLEVQVDVYCQNKTNFGPTWFPDRSKFHENLIQNQTWAVSGASLEKRSKNCPHALIVWSLLGAKLAGLGTQAGATDGQVGGTWGPVFPTLSLEVLVDFLQLKQSQFGLFQKSLSIRLHVFLQMFWMSCRIYLWRCWSNFDSKSELDFI